jgi:hypothetical protein
VTAHERTNKRQYTHQPVVSQQRFGLQPARRATVASRLLLLLPLLGGGGRLCACPGCGVEPVVRKVRWAAVPAPAASSLSVGSASSQNVGKSQSIQSPDRDHYDAQMVHVEPSPPPLVIVLQRVVPVFQVQALTLQHVCWWRWRCLRFCGSAATAATALGAVGAVAAAASARSSINAAAAATCRRGFVPPDRVRSEAHCAGGGDAAATSAGRPHTPHWHLGFRPHVLGNGSETGHMHGLLLLLLLLVASTADIGVSASGAATLSIWACCGQPLGTHSPACSHFPQHHRSMWHHEVDEELTGREGCTAQHRDRVSPAAAGELLATRGMAMMIVASSIRRRRRGCAAGCVEGHVPGPIKQLLQGVGSTIEKVARQPRLVEAASLCQPLLADALHDVECA